MFKSIAQLVAITFVIFFLFNISNKPLLTNIKSVSFDDVRVKVELAVTREERVQGLSGRKSLSDGSGLLFIFEESGLYPFWMKDMNFSIDIIWIDQDLRIVYIKDNAKPSDFPKTYNPEQDAKYVLEVPAGFANKSKLKVGDVVSFGY